MAADERLEAGRHHLDNGIRALRQGYLDESRSYFEAALLQFRGPELRLGEAHGLRGLCEVELHSGNLVPAEGVVREAIREYAEVRNQLDRVDPDQLSHELRRDAEEGEAASHVLLGEVLLRAGRAEEARQALGYAKAMYDGLGEDVPSAAGVYLTAARIGLRDGRTAEALAAADKATTLLARMGDLIGQSGAWLLVAEIQRLAGRLDDANTALGHASRLAADAHQPAMQGRARSQQASILAQQNRLEEAATAYDDALQRIREAGDVEMEAYALLGRGDVRSRSRDVGAIFDLVEATRLLGQLENRHGLGAAMLRLSEHALRLGTPAWSLAAAESARQLWQVTDPKRGVGQALRLEVKALAALRKWPAVITVAHVRAAIAGEEQTGPVPPGGLRPSSNAVEVRDFYRERAPASLLAELDLLDGEQLELRAESMVEALLEPTLRQLDLDFQSLGVPGGALAVVSAFARATPAPAPLRSTPQPVAMSATPPRPDAERSLDNLSQTALDQAPPEEARSEYEGLYAPPAEPGPFAEDDRPRPPLAREDDTTEAAVDEVVERLQGAAVPAEYAGLYEIPGKGTPP